MKLEELKQAFEILKKQGHSEEEIIKSFAKMYLNGQFTLDQFKAVISALGVSTLPGFNDLNEKEMVKHLAKYWKVKK